MASLGRCLCEKKKITSMWKTMPLADHCSPFRHHTLPMSTVLVKKTLFTTKHKKSSVNFFTFHWPHPMLTYPNVGFLNKWTYWNAGQKNCLLKATLVSDTYPILLLSLTTTLREILTRSPAWQYKSFLQFLSFHQISIYEIISATFQESNSIPTSTSASWTLASSQSGLKSFFTAFKKV